MSSCLAILFDDCIYMSSDGAECVIKNGKRYRTRDNIQKINIVNNGDNDYLMFMCGASIVLDEIKSKYLSSIDKSVFMLSKIAKNTYEKHKSALEEYSEKDRGIEIFLACQDTGQTVLNVINNENHFDVEQIIADKPRVLISGCNKDEIKKALAKYFDNSESAMDIYLKVYTQSKVINEDVGGEISIYSLSKNKAQQICDFKVPKYLEANIQRVDEYKGYVLISKNGNYTEFVPDNTGLTWHNAVTSHDYHYLSSFGTATVAFGSDYIAQLGDEFKNKDFMVLTSVKATLNDAGLSMLVNVGAFGAVESKANGTVRISGLCSIQTVDSAGNYVSSNIYKSLTVSYLVIA